MERLEENREVMSRNLRKYLGYNRMTAAELSERLHVSRATVSGWVNGKYYPRISYIEQIAEILNCKKSDLIEDKHDLKSDPPKTFLTVEERLIIEAYRNQPEETKDIVRRLLKYETLLTEYAKKVEENEPV